jgi:hypothetical protein
MKDSKGTTTLQYCIEEHGNFHAVIETYLIAEYPGERTVLHSHVRRDTRT